MIKARLILDPPRDGFWNMAADEALFDNLAKGSFAVTLRVYGWSRPTLSLGRRQKLSDTDVKACRIRSVDVVKRIGGGSAVYHDSEITYCFVSRTGLPGMPDVTDEKIWRDIFLSFLESLGITGDDLGRHQDTKPRATACFSDANGDEPTINGRKWVGSARRKSRGRFLQHGSILLKPQPKFLGELIPTSMPDISAGLTEFAPLLTHKSATDAFTCAVEKKLRLSFSTGDYTDVENFSIQDANTLKTARVSPLVGLDTDLSVPCLPRGL